jgi:hypothetical protein
MGRGAVATPSSHLVVSAGIEHLPPDALPRHLQKYDLLRPRPLKLGRTARPRSQTRKVVSVETAGKKQKHTTGGIPRWSPTLVLVARFSAYVWQSGRDAQFSLTYGRMCLH